MTKESQNKKLLNYLITHKSITPIEGLTKLKIYRVAARIKDLRDGGHKIITERLGRPRYARYVLTKPA